MESARRFGRVFSEFRSVLCPVITHSNLKLSAPDLSKNSRYASVRSRLEARLKFRHLFGSNRFRCTSRFRQWYESWMLAYPSVTTPNLYSDPSLWSVSHCSNLERTSGKASALSTVSFQTERKKKKTEWFWSANNFLQFNYYKSPEKEIRLQGSSSLDAEQSVCCERRNFHFSRAWNKETNLSPRQDSNPDLPDTGGVLLARVLHTAEISNAKSVPCGVQASAEEHHTARWIP